VNGSIFVGDPRDAVDREVDLRRVGELTRVKSVASLVPGSSSPSVPRSALPWETERPVMTPAPLLINSIELPAIGTMINPCPWA
jgi:hypothetical protein